MTDKFLLSRGPTNMILGIINSYIPIQILTSTYDGLESMLSM